MIGIEDARRVTLAGANRAIMVQQLTQLFHCITDVSTQHVLTKKLVEHLAHRALQKRHAARVTGAMPAVRAVFSVVQQGLEERRLHALEVAFGFTDDVTRHKLGRIFKHVNKTVQLAQDIVGNMPAGFSLAVNINRHIQVFAAYFLDEVTQVQHSRVQIRAGGEFLVINRQNESAGPALLLGKLSQVAVTGHTQYFKALGLNGLRQRTNTQT